MMTKRNANICF